MSPTTQINRRLRLDILATIAAGDETMAYVFHESKDPGLKEFGNRLMDNSNDIKRMFKKHLTGFELDLYLLKAEGGPA